MCVQGVDVQCVLQFTLIHAAGCALHRRTSRVIHRIELYSVFVSSGPAKAHRDSSRSRASRLVLGKDRGGSLPAVPGGTLASGSSHSLNRFRHHARRTLARLLRVGQVPHCAGLDTSCGWARGAYPRSSKGRRAQTVSLGTWWCVCFRVRQFLGETRRPAMCAIQSLAPAARAACGRSPPDAGSRGPAATTFLPAVVFACASVDWLLLY